MSHWNILVRVCMQVFVHCKRKGEVSLYQWIIGQKKEKDFNLKVIPRDMSSSDYCKIYSEEFDTKITLPNSEIEKWKTQFK